MSLKASIDIGTNATRLLVAEVAGQEIRPVLMQERITRLGMGMERSGSLAEEAMQRVIHVLKDYSSICQVHGVAEYRTLATSAVREAENGRRFIARIKSETGLEPRILSGEEEALLSYFGATSDHQARRPVMVCDIGGGSTEFVLSNENGIALNKSLPLGSRRATARFVLSDPVAREQISRMEQEIHWQLNSSLQPIARVAECVCVGGTATTLAMMAEHVDISSPDAVHLHTLEKKDLLAIIDLLSALTVAERKKITGLHPDRADVVLTGAVIVRCIMDHLQIDKTTVSVRDLLFGIFLNHNVHGPKPRPT